MVLPKTTRDRQTGGRDGKGSRDSEGFSDWRKHHVLKRSVLCDEKEVKTGTDIDVMWEAKHSLASLSSKERELRLKLPQKEEETPTMIKEQRLETVS